MGISEVYNIGGAQAIAAMAYGTNSLKKVDKITGPGNIFVAKAKQLVSDIVGIDMIAGPTEQLVVADDSADPLIIASDLICQAEHDVNSLSILITDNIKIANKVNDIINKALKEKKDIHRGFYTKDLNLTTWQKFYQQQINNRSLTKLINIHTIDKIIAFLRDNKYIISLRPKWVHEKLDQYKYTPTIEPVELDYNFKESKSFDTNNQKKSILSILEDLE